MIQSKHILDYCCDHPMVICKTCNNNCCSGGYGIVNDKQCPDCPEAYEHENVYFSSLKIPTIEFSEIRNKNDIDLFIANLSEKDLQAVTAFAVTKLMDIYLV